MTTGDRHPLQNAFHGQGLEPRGASLDGRAKVLQKNGACLHRPGKEKALKKVRAEVEVWAQQYEPVHAVAQWDDRQRRGAGNYDAAYENAAEQSEQLLARAGRELAPKLLQIYPTIVWEDQDDCLEVRPEDVQ